MTNKLLAVVIGVGGVAALTFGAPAIVGWSGFSRAGVAGETTATNGPIVVELFTSQSCYSCPPAEAFLGELIGSRSDILALEFHVDYWDDLVYGSAGRWQDVFSSPESTRRQVVYNEAIRGRSGVYTPQMIVHGRREAVGSRRNDVNAALRAVASAEAERLGVVIAPADTGGYTVTLDGPVATPATIWLVRFDRAIETKVLRGENKGKTLTNHNVVRQVEEIGDWRGATMTLELGDLVLGENQGCAVLVQPHPQGPMLGAAASPTTRS